MLGFQAGDFVPGQEREVFQVTDHITVIRLNPELIELVNAGAFGIEPDGARLGLAKFGAVGLGDERQREAKNGATEFLARQIYACRDVAPLIAAANLQLAIVVAAEHKKIKRLKQHVAELGVADA